MLLDNSICPIKEIATFFEGLSPFSQQEALMDGSSPPNGVKRANDTELARSANMSDNLRYVTYFMIDHAHSDILICHLYLAGDDLSELLLYVPERNKILQGFQKPARLQHSRLQDYSLITAYTECYRVG